MIQANDDFLACAERILRENPLIDGHNDLPFLLRQQLKSQIYDHDFNNGTFNNHTDIRRMKEGLMGGQFWSAYVPIPRELIPGAHEDDDSRPHPDLNEPNWAVRDTLEQIDVIKRFIAHHPDDLELCTEPASVWTAHSNGKIASMIGVEGGHQTGNSIATLRMFFESGVRYMTMTHNSDNAFGTSWVSVDVEKGIDAGITKFGEACVTEMNRLGMMVDLSHVSPNTMRGALKVTKAPVIFSHSGAYCVTKHLRNVPNDVLLSVKDKGGIVMVPAVTHFTSENPQHATIDSMIDHIMHIAGLIGWEHVGLGSDFDGTLDIVKGLEDPTKWPSFIARLLARGATHEQAKLLVGENILRVWTEVEHVAKDLQSKGALPCEQTWEGRLWESESPSVPRLFIGKQAEFPRS